MAGVVTVTDAEAFERLLAHGVGRHAAFGYGMMMVARTT
jgi:CRISPR system Cascade subunit CasE